MPQKPGARQPKVLGGAKQPQGPRQAAAGTRRGAGHTRHSASLPLVFGAGVVVGQG